jgi:signal transduction histidine kinase
MGASLERRCAPGGAQLDHDQRWVRGLLHDLAHQIAAMSYLVEAVREDSSLTGESGARLELLAGAMSRALDLLGAGFCCLPGGSGPGYGEQVSVGLRPLAEQVARLTAVAHGADVTLVPGPDVRVQASPALLWRVLSNVAGNAARAAGRGGQVTVAVSQPGDTLIEVSDNGPGFGAGAPGLSSLGLEIVDSLLSSCGGRLEVGTRAAGGTTVRIVLPARLAPRLAVAGAARDA